MNRGYTCEEYLRLVRQMRATIPGVAITSDLIVGFPGESEEDFRATLAMVEKVRFDSAFTFMYSPRTGTRAADLKEQVPLEIKKERLLRLNEVQYQIAREANRQLENQAVEVLVEGQSKTDSERLTGRTRTNRIVVFEGGTHLVGKLLQVVVREARTFTLYGELPKGEGALR